MSSHEQCKYSGCSNPVPVGRRSFCSEICGSRYRNEEHDHKRARTTVFERDGGVCLRCGKNTMQMRAEHIENLIFKFPGQLPAITDQLHPELRPIGFPSLRHSWWQADHRTPLVEGGTSNPEDYQTLCVPCHKTETRSLQCRRAENRRASGTISLPLTLQ